MVNENTVSLVMMLSLMKTLKKGKYALFTIPSIQSWEVIYTATDNWELQLNSNEANGIKNNS
jgi:hypothetical protein